MSITRSLARAGCAAAVLSLVPAVVANADQPGHGEPRLTGRAVLPADTVSDGPPAGAFLTGTSATGMTFPRPAQPVEGFSGVVEGRRRGEYLAMPDNGFGNKANSFDFLIRAYYVSPDFKTAERGAGAVEVRDYISFRDPNGLIGFPIINEGTAERLLTGADIDPESIQRDHRGDLWIGDEFGPWILHFDATGRLEEPPISLPDGLRSPVNPLPGGPATVNNSRGLEAMALTPNGKRLVMVLEGAVPGDDPFSRRIYVYDIRSKSFTQAADYKVDVSDKFVADAQAIDDHRLLVIERDGLVAAVRTVYAVDLDDVGPDGAVTKRAVLDLAAIPDPDGISLPAIHEGDVGIGDPFRVACESIESLHVESGNELMLTCDNNLPNAGRNPTRADDTEMIVVNVPGLTKKHGR